jgi:hypothetical protein|tara:strand:+ start:7193 stop:7846 length:654 start_codon:yes stop_codon:yes gene_type:complete
MAGTLKHIGRINNTGVKVLVVFRTLPGESNMALVLPVHNLPDVYHDSIMTTVESDQSQEAFEFGEIMFIRPFPDGRPMLQAMQADGRLQKVATDAITMTPTTNDTILLSQLNVLIAEQKNCTVDDLTTFVKGAPKKDPNAPVVANAEAQPLVDPDVPAPVRAQASSAEALSDKDIAKSYRSQADAMYKEAARLRKEADLLDPAVKKASKKVEEPADA